MGEFEDKAIVVKLIEKTGASEYSLVRNGTFKGELTLTKIQEFFGIPSEDFIVSVEDEKVITEENLGLFIFKSKGELCIMMESNKAIEHKPQDWAEENNFTITQNLLPLVAKVLVVGDSDVGKTTLVHGYCTGNFHKRHTPTLGFDFKIKVVQKGDSMPPFCLQFWDSAGQDRFGCLTHSYRRDAQLVLIVFDLSSKTSWKSVEKWKYETIEANPRAPPPIFLVGNKLDKMEESIPRVVETRELETFCKENGFSGCFEISCKENTNIDQLMDAVIETVKPRSNSKRRGTVELCEKPNPSTVIKDKSRCCET